MIENVGEQKNYEVGVSRQYVCRGTTTVRASSAEEARLLGLDQIGDVALTMDELVEGGDRVEFMRAVSRRLPTKGQTSQLPLVSYWRFSGSSR